ncbi:hypothetical protein IH982_02410 [Patescibacteria group bacterium]|nr:hypothetical protein [Patescibacteria group bacterium]
MKIQELPVKQRKVILWAVVAVLGIMLFFWWGRNVKETLENVSLPKVPKELKESLQRTQEEFTFPAFEEIEIPEEVFKELQEYGQSQGQ